MRLPGGLRPRSFHRIQLPDDTQPHRIPDSGTVERPEFGSNEFADAVADAAPYSYADRGPLCRAILQSYGRAFAGPINLPDALAECPPLRRRRSWLR